MSDLSVFQVQEALRAHAANGIDLTSMGPSGNFKLHGKPFLANMPELKFHGNNGDFSHLNVHAPIDEGGAKKLAIRSTATPGDSYGYKSVSLQQPLLSRLKDGKTQYWHGTWQPKNKGVSRNLMHGDLEGKLHKHFVDYDNVPYDIHDLIDEFRTRIGHGNFDNQVDNPRDMTTEEHAEFRDAWLNHGRPLRVSDAFTQQNGLLGPKHLSNGFPIPQDLHPRMVRDNNGEYNWDSAGGTIHGVTHNNIIVLNPKPFGTMGMDHYVYTPHTEELHRLD